MQVLRALRIDDRTIVFLTSDNGYHLGQTRMYGKTTPYLRSTNVPTIVWGPPWVSPLADPLPHLLAHIDLAPTIVELAGGNVPEHVQGRSFVPLLASREVNDSASWRPDGILIEHWELTASRGQLLATTYCSLRLPKEVYTQWADGDREYYRLESDPYELENQAASLDPLREAQLVKMIEMLRGGLNQPMTFIESPFPAASEVGSEFELRGIADYRSPLDTVEVTVREREGQEDRFWDGKSWGTRPTSLLAELSNSRGVISAWRCPVSIPQSVGKRLEITARAVGMDGLRDERGVTRQVIVLGDFPWFVVDRPTLEEKTEFYRTRTLAISGWTEDVSPVRSVRLVIADRTNGQFWNGTNWQSESTSVVASLQRHPGSNRVAWEYHLQSSSTPGAIEIIPRLLSRDRPQALRLPSFHLYPQ